MGNNNEQNILINSFSYLAYKEEGNISFLYPFESSKINSNLSPPSELENSDEEVTDKNDYLITSSMKINFSSFQNDMIKNEDQNNKIYFNIKKNISGRKPKIENKKRKKYHDKYSSDNMIRFIQVHYLTFIRNYVNEILYILGFEQKFFDINYKCKRNVTKKAIEKLKASNIGDILCQKISPKYKDQAKDEEKNLKIFNEVTKNSTVKNILEENYLQLFKDVYYKNKRNINLSNYGLNINIKLSNNIKTYEDLLKKKHINNSVNNEIYKKKLNKIVVKHFLPNSIFLCD